MLRVPSGHEMCIRDRIYTTKENKMDPIIRIDNLIFEYQKDENEVPKRALNNINLQIERGLSLIHSYKI